MADDPGGETESLARCVLCDSGDEGFGPYANKSGYRIVRCQNCGLVFVNPRDRKERVLRQYSMNETSPILYYQTTRPVDETNFSGLLDRIEEKIPKGDLLDVGCNVGTFLEVARRRGWRVRGIDANQEACQSCRVRGLDVTCGLFDKDLVRSYPEKSFDLISMNDSIEHFLNPTEALALAARLLRDRGWIAVTTPNIASILARIFQTKPREHLFYFDRNTLSRALSKAGFHVEMILQRGRKRNVGAMHLGATFENRIWVWVSKILDRTHLDGFVSRFLEIFFHDELFALARKA